MAKSKPTLQVRAPKNADDFVAGRSLAASGQPSTPGHEASAAQAQPATPELEVSAASVQPATPELEVSAASVQPSTPELEVSAASVQPSTPKHEVSAASVQPSTSGHEASAASAQLSTPGRQPRTGKATAPRVRGLVQRADGAELARITVYLEPAVAMKLKRHCLENGLQVTDLAAKAVSNYVAKL